MKKPKPTKRPKPHKKPRKKAYLSKQTHTSADMKSAYNGQLLGILSTYPRLGICGEPIY